MVYRKEYFKEIPTSSFIDSFNLVFSILPESGGHVHFLFVPGLELLFPWGSLVFVESMLYFVFCFSLKLF
jgi:hypothetical protein